MICNCNAQTSKPRPSRARATDAYAVGRHETRDEKQLRHQGETKLALRHALDRGFQDRWHVPEPPRESTPTAILWFKFKTYVINANPHHHLQKPPRVCVARYSPCQRTAAPRARPCARARAHCACRRRPALPFRNGCGYLSATLLSTELASKELVAPKVCYLRATNINMPNGEHCCQIRLQ